MTSFDQMPKFQCLICKDYWECENNKSILNGCPGFVHFLKPLQDAINNSHSPIACCPDHNCMKCERVGSCPGCDCKFENCCIKRIDKTAPKNEAIKV
jgi:hypothetical protein